MHFLDEIRKQAGAFETEASAEIQRFVAELEKQFEGAFIGEKKAIVKPPIPAATPTAPADNGILPTASYVAPIVAPPALKENGELGDIQDGVKYDFSMRPEVAAKMGISIDPVPAITPEEAPAIAPVEAPVESPQEVPVATVESTPAESTTVVTTAEA